ncbi:hypothetical protein [Luteimonas sp. TWI1437]|uniref:hypothetical protein n=1 Tax=unclassified Luteimonas TaxID=2629088 RepID=UPI0032095605
MTTLQSATNILLTHYDQVLDGRTGLSSVFGGGNIREGDLERIAQDADAPQDLRDAAQFLLDSKVSRNFLDVGAGKGGADGRISREDLEAALETIASGEYYDELLDTAAGRGGSWNPFVQGARDGRSARGTSRRPSLIREYRLRSKTRSGCCSPAPRAGPSARCWPAWMAMPGRP